jgi:hypothetical protein
MQTSGPNVSFEQWLIPFGYKLQIIVVTKIFPTLHHKFDPKESQGLDRSVKQRS